MDEGKLVTRLHVNFRYRNQVKSMTSQLNTLFAVPFVHLNFVDTALHAQLSELLLARQSNPQAINQDAAMRIQNGVFESNFDFFAWPDPPIKELARRCTVELWKLVSHVSQLNRRQLDQLEMKVDAWYHVTRFGGFHASHNHPMASWSGVYCVDPGDTPDGYPDSGVLSLHNPHAMANMFIDASNAKLAHPYGSAGYGIHFKAGDLVLFPAWLWHQAMPYFGTRPRITAAFNAWFVPTSG